MRIKGAQNFSKSFGGKIGKICTAFTLTTFFDKNYKRVPLDFSAAKIINRYHLEHKTKKNFRVCTPKQDFESSRYLFDVFKMVFSMMISR